MVANRHFIVGALLLASAGMVLLARPYARENAAPLPVTGRGQVMFEKPGVEGPALKGPDTLERAPQLAVAPGVLILELGPSGMD